MSLDPRINRVKLPQENTTVGEQEYWQTFEVFHQEKRGKHHVHVGAVHAPDAEMALVFAKEQYARRKQCVNLWVVPSSEIFAFHIEDEDMFETTPDKQHREAAIYSKVRDRIERFKAKLKS